MKQTFELPDFPNSSFEIETSLWTGKTTLHKDNVKIDRSKEKGKPFLISKTNGDIVKAYPKSSFPEFIPTLEINGNKYQIVEKLQWFQYILGGLPILLLFVGGAIGGAIGAVGSMVNFSIFRQDGPETLKYLKVIGVVIVSFSLYFILSALISELVM